MRAVLSLLNQETCAADNDIMPVVDKRLQQLLEVEQLRTAFNERYIVDAERRLKRSHLIKFVEQHVGVGVFLDFHNHTHVFAR